MTDNDNIYHSEEHDKIQKSNTLEWLNNIAESHSIKDQLLKKRLDDESLENVTKVRRKQDDREDNSDGTFKISNFL